MGIIQNIKECYTPEPPNPLKEIITSPIRQQASIKSKRQLISEKNDLIQEEKKP
jgi:hypothetical protein